MPPTATTSFFIDKYHPRADKKCAISIRVTHNRIKRYYATLYNLCVTDYYKMCSQRPRKELKAILLQLQAEEKRAADVIKNLPYFSFAAFEKKYIQNTGLSTGLNQAFSNYINHLNSEDRVGTASSYSCAKASLEAYCIQKKISMRKTLIEKTGEEQLISDYTFFDVDICFLERYEQWMLIQRNSPTTVGFYLRPLRALFNIAIANGLITREFYPFGKNKYEIPTSKNKKKALKLSDIEAIYNYRGHSNSKEEMAKDYWLFMYLCSGMNLKDVCLLQWKHLDQNFIEYVRSKTIRTKKVTEKIRIPLLPEAKEIIVKYSVKTQNPNDYIFDLITPGLSAKRQREIIQLRTRIINKYINKICKALGISRKVTTYVARHSYGSVLKRAGASTEFIQESYGHKSVKTTENYLDSFEDEQKIEITKALVAFKRQTP